MIDTFAKLHVDYDWPIAPSLSHVENRPFSQIISHCFSDLWITDFNLFAIGWWFIWYFRNQVVFQNAPSSFSSAATVINNFTPYWLRTSSVISDGLSGSVSLAPKLLKHLIKEILWFGPPPPRFAKINFDGSKLKCGKSSYGFVIRDEHGMVILLVQIR